MPLEIKKSCLLLLLIGSSLIFTYCSTKPISYGMVLWAKKESPFLTGEIIQIIKESQIQKSYLVRLGDSRELKEIPFWRVRAYPDLKKAQAGAADYAQNKNMFGYAEKDGLPIRDKPHQEAKRVYKLREGQLLKILNRSVDKVIISGYEDYWYRVLTEDGCEGFCFGYYLGTFSTRGDPHAEVQHLMAKDQVLDNLLSTVWRPEYFREMADSGKIDLLRFNKFIGLFPDRNGKRIDLITSKYQEIFSYEAVEKVGPNRYHFLGTGLRIYIEGDTRIILTYTKGGQITSAVYVLFDQDIDQIISGERGRRFKLFKEFVSRGRLLHSTAYGSIELLEGMRFFWDDFGSLSFQIFPGPVEGRGVVDFPYYLSAELLYQFDGIITFQFDEYPGQEGTSFLYKFDNRGVRFVFIRPQDIVDLEAVHVGITPLVIYFDFGNP